MSTPGMEIANKLVQEEEEMQLSFSRTHQWAGRGAPPSPFSITVKHTKSSDRCAFSPTEHRPSHFKATLTSDSISVACLHTKHREKWTSTCHSGEDMSALKQTLHVICWYPTCRCTEEVMGLPSCCVSRKKIESKFSSPKKPKGTWGLSAQRSKEVSKNWSSPLIKTQAHIFHSFSYREGEKSPTQPLCSGRVRLWRNRQRVLTQEMGGEEWVWGEGVWRTLK